MTALFSINPKFACSILAGEKRVEYRRVKCKYPICRILIYATRPICKVIGEVSVTKTISEDKTLVWLATNSFSGIDEDAYFRYFTGRNNAIAFFLDNPKKYDIPLCLEDLAIKRAPQSFCYLDF